MAKNIARERFMSDLHAGRARWEAALAAVPAERMEVPGASRDGRWSVKDIVAHVVWHEREMIGLLEARALAGSELWLRPLDERNEAIYGSYREQPLAVLLTGAAAAWSELLRLLEGLSEEELNEAGRFADMPPDWLPWELIAGNTYQHYREHAAQIERWLGQGAPGGR